MPKIDAVTVPINFEVTEASKTLIRGLIAEVLLDDLKKGDQSDIRAFIRTEVRKALAEVTSDIRKGIHHD